jgi:hypothetical protein
MRGKQLGREEKRDDKNCWQVEGNCEEWKRDLKKKIDDKILRFAALNW